MRFFDSWWERAALTPTKLRLGLMLLSLVAMVLGGAAAEYWD